MEGATRVRRAFHPNLSAVEIRNLLADCQTYAGARYLPGMKPFEDAEDALVVGRVDTDPVISYKYLDNSIFRSNTADMDHRLAFRRPIFQPVRKKILQQLNEMRA